MKTHRATVQGVGAIINGKAVLLAIERKATFADAVAVTPDEGAEKSVGAIDDVVDAVMSLHDVAHLAVAVGNHDGTECTTVIGESHFTTLVVCENEKVGLLPVDNFLKIGLFKTRQIVGITYVFHDFAFLE